MRTEWFIWKGRNSFSEFGLWVRKLPKRTTPRERHEEIEIPGRPGCLILTEGDEIYSSYNGEMIVSCKNTINLDRVKEWLRGSGELIISDDINKAYHARIVNEVTFEREGKQLFVGTIPFLFQPFKYSAHPQDDQITINATGTISNPGNAISKPKLTVSKWGETSIAIGDTQMSFEHLPEEVVIDCDAEMITTKAIRYVGEKYYYRGDYATYWGEEYDNGLYRFLSEGTGSQQQWEYVGEWTDNFWYAWPGKWEGEFLRIHPGENVFTLITDSPDTTPITIDPNWRWV